MNDIIQQIRSAYGENPESALKLLPELFRQYDVGLILVLPCKVGNKIYCIDPYKRKIVEDHVANIKSENDYEDGFYGEFSGYGHTSYRKNFSEIGKTIFLAREDAEAALKERKK